MSLHGRTIVITRPIGQSDALAAEIEARGGRVLVFPLILIAPPESWEACDRGLANLQSYDGILLTSVNGVEKFFERAAAVGIDRAAFAGCDIYAVGEKTRRAIEQRGFSVALTPERFSAASLAESLAGKDLLGKKFLFPCGTLGRDELGRRLGASGAEVDAVVVYRTMDPDPVVSESLRLEIRKGGIDVVAFASPSAAEHFAKIMPAVEFDAVRDRTKVAVIGPTTAQAVRALSLPVDILSDETTSGGMAQAIDEYYSR
jgi:uroporphyrinogen III methyltransferase/synthase